MKYVKPHLSYQKQLAQLRHRGLAVEDISRATSDLKRIGYYRLSGYTYPMRTFDDDPQQIKRGHRKRTDNFVKGASFENAVALHDFDHRLRGILLDGLQQLEVGLRVQVGYTLGKKGALAHLDETTLGPKARQIRRTKPQGATSNQQDKSYYKIWRAEYDSLQKKALQGKQEFVIHFTNQYDSEVPIWAAVSFMTMGCLVTLYDLLEDKDKHVIARSLGVKSQRVLIGWLRPLNILRNHCAHGNRIWNRPIPFQSNKINPDMLIAPELLEHLASSPKPPVDHRVYFHASTMAYLLRFLSPNSNWSRDFVATMHTFPSPVSKQLSFSPVNSMGFTEGWENEDLWRDK